MKRLKKIRADRGFTIYSLADRLGVNFSAVSLWENGHRFPRQPVLIELEDLFGVGYREMFADMTPEEIEDFERSQKKADEGAR